MDHRFPMGPAEWSKAQSQKNEEVLFSAAGPSCQPQPSCEIPILSADPVRIPERTVREEINCLNAVLVSS
ncbi:hypothetical protein ATANTOWER_007006 [Ataeniobius toweri]|uniref:Uncharacterized protein n=1 Tax=Ataeniobius toweri TaxID=208326 RepID=A0ABU7B7U9_9TELE|nr:hypothetical protein [Ataeniobius toweri]